MSQREEPTGERSEGPRYPTDYEEGTSHAHAVALIERSGVGPGVVVDLGCGNAPVAAPLSRLGFTYVGLDVDRATVARLVERGIEAHLLDLSVSKARLVKHLVDVIGDRPLAAVLALDVLEHLAQPEVAVQALADLARAHQGCSLVVSIPNVTHVDVGVRLLLGRWETTRVGLLDDTHLRYFSGPAFDQLFASAGWREVDAEDTLAGHSDQYFLEPLTALQPAAPVRALLWRWRHQAGPYSTTYQFVRRFELAAADEPEAIRADATPGPFGSVVVSVDAADELGALGALLADLAGQQWPATAGPDLEVIVLARPGVDPAKVLDQVPTTGRDLGPVLRVVEVEPVFSHRNAGIDAAGGRYLCFLDATDRVALDWLASLRRAAGDIDDVLHTDAVVRVDAAVVSPQRLADGLDEPFSALVEAAEPVRPDGFDLLNPGELGTTCLAAYAIPATVVRSMGLHFEERPQAATTSLFVARSVELAGLRAFSGVAVAVAPDAARPGGLDVEWIAEVLKDAPLLLASGGSARLAALHRTLAALRVEAARARVDWVAERNSLIAERDAAEARLQALLATPPLRVARLARRAYRELRARVNSARRPS